MSSASSRAKHGNRQASSQGARAMIDATVENADISTSVATVRVFYASRLITLHGLGDGHPASVRRLSTVGGSFLPGRRRGIRAVSKRRFHLGGQPPGPGADSAGGC